MAIESLNLRAQVAEPPEAGAELTTVTLPGIERTLVPLVPESTHVGVRERAVGAIEFLE